MAPAGRSRSSLSRLGHRQLVLQLDVEGPALPGEQLPGVPRARWGLHEFERVGRVVDARQHRRLEQQRQHLALLGLPADLRRRQRELVLDADVLGHGLDASGWSS